MKLLPSNKLVGLSVLLLFLLYYAGPVTLRQMTGTPFGRLGSGLVSRFVGWWFWSLLLCLYGILLGRVSMSSRRRAVLTGLPVVFAVLMGGVSLYNSLPSVRAQKILAGAQFAPLPASASRIKVLAWYTPFSGEEYLRFRADPIEIKSFLTRSGVLEGTEYEEYSHEKMRLFFPRDAGGGLPYHDAHEYVNKDETAPPWYRQEIRDAAKRYRIRPKGYDSGGEVIVEESTGLIFIKLVIS
jgi:hypothetical protein